MRASSLLPLAFSFSVSLTAASLDLEPCVAMPVDARAACVEAQLAEGALELAAARGVRRLDWWVPGDALAWSAALDDPAGRRIDLARTLIALDRGDEARSLLENALRQGAGDEAQRLWENLSDAAVSGLDAVRTPLVAGPWFPRLPRVAVPLTDGESLALADLRGKVLVLDFWASWCEPCLKELPELGRLYDSEHTRGLEVIAVNMGESPRHAERFARKLGLEMPVGVYDDELEGAFDARSLPTVVVADRDGRVRARWDGYRDGLESEIADLVRGLLTPDAGEAGAPVGEVLLGGDLLEVEWARNVTGGIDGLAVASLEGPGAAPHVVAVAGRYALVYDWRGAVVSFVDRPLGSGALRSGDLDGDGVDELFSFRSGGKRVSWLDLEQGDHRSWDSPEPMLDLALLPPAGEVEGAIALATIGGLYRARTDLSIHPVAGFDEPSGLAPLPDPRRYSLALLSRKRGLCRLNPAAPESALCADGREGERLVIGSPSGGVGTVPRGVAGVGGRFLDGPQGEVALVTSSGQFVIVDAESGDERFRARLEEPRAIAAGDVDGDGRDELALAVGSRLLLLKYRSAGPVSRPATEN